MNTLGQGHNQEGNTGLPSKGAGVQQVLGGGATVVQTASSLRAEDLVGLAKPRIPLEDTEIHTWFERDRAHVELRHIQTQETIVEWWDEAVTQALEDGFLSAGRGPRPSDEAFRRSAYEYAECAGMLDPAWFIQPPGPLEDLSPSILSKDERAQLVALWGKEPNISPSEALAMKEMEGWLRSGVRPAPQLEVSMDTLKAAIGTLAAEIAEIHDAWWSDTFMTPEGPRSINVWTSEGQAHASLYRVVDTNTPGVQREDTLGPIARLATVTLPARRGGI